MTEQELQQEHRFYFPQDRLRYLLTRTLARTVLSRYTNVAPERLSFVYNAFGKPEISEYLGAGAQWSFNISHTQSLIVIAVTREGAIGVDVEDIGLRKAPWEIAEHYFATEEVEALRALPQGMRNKRFFQYWTLKESYIKARGMGLTIPLDGFSFDIAADHLTLNLHPQLDDVAFRWRFWQLQVFNANLIAVCAERRRIEQNLTVFRILPLEEEETLEYQVICRSQ